MIISASRRTDIPSYYSQWFYNRIKEGYVLVRNPVNLHQVGRIALSPDVVDGIVFWTKNPVPMMDRLGKLKKYNYYFQFTLTSYGREIEPNLPSKNAVLIPAFDRLSGQIGKERVLWRYDPIFLSSTYTIEYHIKYFRILAAKLAPYTERCILSFLDMYRNIKTSMKNLGIRPPTEKEQDRLMEEFSKIAGNCGLILSTCAEEGDFSRYGVSHACCIDKSLFERIGEYKLDVKKDPNQREACGCISSIDIGAYNTCKNGCIYCYANHNKKTMTDHFKCYDPSSSLLLDSLNPDDVIRERKMVSLANGQRSLFDLSFFKKNIDEIQGK